MNSYFIGIALCLFGAVFSLFFKNQSLKLKVISVFSGLTSLCVLCSAVNVFLNGQTGIVINLGSIFQNVRFSLDYLSAFFVIVISVMSFLGIIYSNGYLKSYIEKGYDLSAHCVFLPLLFASMLGVVAVQNALAFLIIWELMSLSSFFLVIFENDKKDVIKAGIKYLVYMHISVIFIILYFVIMSINASSLDFIYFKEALENNITLANLVFVLAFVGFGIKAGFVPFHNWLPDAHPAAPSHVSAIMSGVMIKTGIYGILRALTFISVPDSKIGYFVLIISVISALYGVLYAICQHDLKRLLAYHSIENIGIIGIGIGIGMLGLAYNNPIVALLGFAGGILHVLNHSIFKELLFLSAGSVYTKTHTRDIEILGGLSKPMPKTALAFLIGSIAICGLPPFNGFVSEFLIYVSMLKGLMIDNVFVFLAMILALSGLALVGTMAILCFTKAFSIVFLGEARSETAQRAKDDTTISFLLPMLILSLFTIIIGLGAKQITAFVFLVTGVFVEGVQTNAPVELMQTIAIISASTIVLIAVLYTIKKAFFNKHEKHTTWGCGYNRVSAHMQYSASSYASPFITMLTPLFKKVVDVKKPKSVFVKEAHYEAHMEDVEEAYFLKPFIKSVEKFFSGFERIQNGNIQSYIMYGLIFLFLCVAGVVFLG